MYLFPEPFIRSSNTSVCHCQWILSGVPPIAWKRKFLLATHVDPPWWSEALQGRAAIWQVQVQDFLLSLRVQPFLYEEGLMQRRIREVVSSLAVPERDLGAEWQRRCEADPEYVKGMQEIQEFLEDSDEETSEVPAEPEEDVLGVDELQSNASDDEALKEAIESKVDWIEVDKHFEEQAKQEETKRTLEKEFRQELRHSHPKSGGVGDEPAEEIPSLGKLSSRRYE